MRDVGELAARTPADRVRYVDLLRALAILLVVVGHWLAAVVFTVDGRLTGQNVLTVLPWAHWLTWVFQVMPVFFLVAGFAGAASWRSAMRRQVPATVWLGQRAERILRPTAAFLTVVIGCAVIARAAGVDGAVVTDAAWLSGIALWFLAAYLAVVAATPLTWRWHERFGLAVPAIGAALVAVLDLAHRWGGLPGVGWVNAVLLWAVVHQLGYAWQDGRLRAGPRSAVSLAGGGLAALVLLTGPGPYPVSMVSVPGEPVQNASPPSLALLALAAAQAGLVLLAHERGTRWCAGPRRWRAVVAVNAVAMSLYLWHLAVLVVGAALLHGTGLLPEPAPGSAAWYSLRPLWVAALAGIMIVVLAAVARWERPRTGGGGPAGNGPARPLAGAVAVAGVIASCGGLVLLTVGGLSPPATGGVPVAGVALLAIGGLALTRWPAGARTYRHAGSPSTTPEESSTGSTT